MPLSSQFLFHYSKARNSVGAVQQEVTTETQHCPFPKYSFVTRSLTTFSHLK